VLTFDHWVTVLFSREPSGTDIIAVGFHGLGDHLGHVAVLFDELWRECLELPYQIAYYQELAVAVRAGPDGKYGDSELFHNIAGDLRGHGLHQQHSCTSPFNSEGVFHHQFGGIVEGRGGLIQEQHLGTIGEGARE